MSNDQPDLFGNVERSIPVMGKAIEGAILKVAPGNPFVFFLFILDPTTGRHVWQSNGERESFRAVLQEFLTTQAH